MAKNGKSFVKFWCAVLKLAFKSINHLYNAALVGAAWQHHPSKRGFVRMAVDFYHWPSNTFIQFCVSAPYANISFSVLKLWVCCFSLPRIPLLCIISIKFDNIIYSLDFFCIKKLMSSHDGFVNVCIWLRFVSCSPNYFSGNKLASL